MSNRREGLIKSMEDLEAKGFGCRGCAGTCCTYEANSMMLTPLEAVELYLYLKKQNMLRPELREKFKGTVSLYRLDHQVGNGKRSYLRRTYTCPLFGHKELGCPLPREVKPYGCLAFNSYHAELKADHHCKSDSSLLQKREDENQDEKIRNEKLKNRLGIYWDKSPLPTALLDLWDLEISDADLE